MLARLRALVTQVKLTLRGPSGLIILLSGLFILPLAACQAEPSNGTTLAPPVPISQASPTVPPPVLVTVSHESEPRSFSAVSAVELQEPTTNEVQAREVFTATAVPDQQPSEAAPAATPDPTFTPPAQPEQPEWDHYWLYRPVPEGSTVWTDKAYPYGSTRGGELRAHHGVEFNVPTGTSVLAAGNGTVVTAGADDVETVGAENNFYGNVVVIRHDIGLGDKPLFTLYGHLSEILVAVGDEVNAKDVIALSGASGVADGPHLHFEVRLGTNEYTSTRNPLLWLYPFPDRGVVAGLVTYADGSPAPNVPLNLRRIDAPSPYAATTSYAGGDVNPDDRWAENFALDDVYAGYYELTAGTGEDKVKVELWVHPYQTSFVEVTLEP
ncbi:MAG: M23 family metallopeptidase [Candidatus Promineifilaceae bacterium]